MSPEHLLALLLAAPAATAVTCQTETVQVQMRDGLSLNTIVIRPKSDEKVGAILVRTPYGARLDSLMDGKWCRQNGFAAVVQDDRGSGKSPGLFNLFGRTGTDGYDTVEWITKQAWSNGKVGTTGGSALGIAQYTQLINPHPRPHPGLRAVNPIVAEAFGHQLNFQGGAYREGLMDGWLHGQGDDYLIPVTKAHEGWSEFYQNTSGFFQAPAEDGSGLISGFDRARGHAAWGVHMAGWYDIFSTLQIQTVDELNNTALGATAPHWLIVEPTGHCSGGAVKWANVSFGSQVQDELVSAMFALRVGDPTPTEEAELRATLDAIPRLTYYITGPGTDGSLGNFWVQAPTWPETALTALYLGAGGSLTPTEPSKSSVDFAYDPADPVKTLGGNNLVLKPCGPQDQRQVDDGRGDVLTYEGNTLTAPLTVVGNVTAELEVGSNASDTDFVVKLVDVWPDGTRMLVQDGILRMRWRDGPWATDPAPPMEQGSVYDALVVVGGVSHVFNAGHKVGITVTSSNSPRFITNPNTGEALSKNSTASVVALNTIYHGLSRLLLPVVTNSPALTMV